MSKAARGEIWEVNLYPSVGAEIQKIRPAVAMSVAGIGKLPLLILVPITEWNPEYVRYPWFIRLRPNAKNGLAKDSGADAFQTKSVSESRLIRRIGVLSPTEVEDIAAAIAMCIGYEPEIEMTNP